MAAAGAAGVRYLDETAKLSRINGAINNLTRAQLRHELRRLGLRTEGADDVVRSPAGLPCHDEHDSLLISHLVHIIMGQLS